MTEWSRYRRDFQEISFIAAGGFGNVFKALHRLDGIEYAIKKIIVRSGRIKNILQHLEEVKTLAKLNHTNIVSYKGAWIEPILPSNFIPYLMCPNYAQTKLSSIEHKRKSGYKSCINQTFNSQNQQSNEINIKNSQSLKESNEENILSKNSKQMKYSSGMCNYVK